MDASISDDPTERLLAHFSQYPPLQESTILMVARHWLRVDDRTTARAIHTGQVQVRRIPAQEPTEV